MGSEATSSSGGCPMPIDAALAEIPDACDMEEILLLVDESAGHVTPDPQSAGDISHAIAGPTGAEEQNAHACFVDWPEAEAGPGLMITQQEPATYSVGHPSLVTGTESIPRSSIAPSLDVNMQAALTSNAAVKDILLSQGLALPELERDRDPYSAAGDTRSCPSTAADTGSRTSLDLLLDVNGGVVGLPQSSVGAVSEAAVRGSSKRKKLVSGSSSQRSTPPPEFNLEELLDVIVQSDPSSTDIKPPTGSTDWEIIDFLFEREETSKLRGAKEVNVSVGEQDQSRPPKADRSYVTTVPMMPDQNTHLGYWKEKHAETVRDDRSVLLYGGLKRTFQFHRYDGTKTNWFMHEYVRTALWGPDLFMKRLRYREVYYNQGEEVPEVKPKNKAAPAKKHRMRGPDNMVDKGESPAWHHFIKIYDRHPELEGSKVVYAVCCHCEGVLKADNGTNSLLTHCNRTCPVKNKTNSQQASLSR